MGTEQFAVTRYYLAAFMPLGAVSTYLGIWLANRGLTGAEIGLVNAVPMAFILAFSIFFGRLADRAKDWKQAIVIGHGLGFLFLMPLFGAQSFWPILIVWTLAAVPAGLAQPVADAASMRLALRRGFSFGTVRGWGTLGYMLVCGVTGLVIWVSGDAAFLWIMVVTAGLRLGSAALLPALREAGAERPKGRGVILSAELLAALKLWVLLPLIAAALILATHAALGAFAPVVWLQQGIGTGMIGLLVAVGAAAEVAAMWLWAPLQRRFSARALIGIAAAAAVLRWGAMALAPPLWLLLGLQLLHGVTFGFTLLGAVYFIANRTGEKVAAEAQSLFGVMQQGASVAVLGFFGLLFDGAGPRAFFATALIALAVLPLIWLSLRLQAGDEAAPG